MKAPAAAFEEAPTTAFEEAPAAAFEEALGMDLFDLAYSPDLNALPSAASSFRAKSSIAAHVSWLHKVEHMLRDNSAPTPRTMFVLFSPYLLF